MDKFLTFEGQQPIYLGDIEFLQNASLKTLKTFFQGLADSPKIRVKDATPTSSGVVIIDGEVLELRDERSGNEVSSSIVIKSTYSGGRTLKNGSYCQCYEERYAALVGDSSGYSAADFVDIQDVLRSNIKSTGGRANDYTSDGNMNIRVALKQILNDVFCVVIELEGQASGTTSGKIFEGTYYTQQKPVPGTYFGTICHGSSNANSEVVPVRVEITNSGSTTAVEVYCNSFTYDSRTRGYATIIIIG